MDNHKTLRSSARNAAIFAAGIEAGLSSPLGPLAPLGPIGPSDCISVAITYTLSELEPTGYYPGAKFDILQKRLLIRIVTQLYIKKYDSVSRYDQY